MRQLLLAIALTTAFHSTAQAQHYYSRVMDKVIVGKVTQAALESAPNWPLDDPNPPMPPRKALAIAVDELAKIDDALGVDGHQTPWKLLSISLRPARSNRWYWLAEFDRTPPGSMSLSTRLKIPIAMNGRVLTQIRDATSADDFYAHDEISEHAWDNNALHRSKGVEPSPTSKIK